MTGFWRRLRATRRGRPAMRIAVPAVNLRRIRRRSLDLLGWPGVVGIGLLSVCPALYVSAILPAREELASVRHGVLALREQLKNAGRGGESGRRTPEEQLAGFYRMFPDGGNLPAHLEKMFALAQEEGIWLDKGEYKVIRGREGKLVSFQVTLPLKGEYLRIRKYLAALRSGIPVLSLQQVEFKRQKVGDPVVEANIRLALHLLERKP